MKVKLYYRIQFKNYNSHTHSNTVCSNTTTHRKRAKPSPSGEAVTDEKVSVG